MEKGNINVIIFEDQQPSMKEQRESRTVHSSKHFSSSNNHHLEIIEQQIAYLSDKIKSLQQLTDSALHLKNQSNLSCNKSKLNQQPPEDHTKEILMLIQKKIQIIVRQTKKIVDRMGQNFEKRLQLKLNKKYDETGVVKMRENYNEAIKRIELGYRKELEKVNKQHKEVEAKMLARVNLAQQRFATRMAQFQTKQKEYVDWIHHLEAQLKEKNQIQSIQNKPKRMIEVTHAANPLYRKQNQQTSSVITGDNSAINPKSCNPPPNDSRIQRRHRIFDPMTKSSSSISPNQRVVSPLSAQLPQFQSNTLSSSKIVAPQLKPRMTQKLNPVNEPVLTPINRLSEPLRNTLTNSGANEASTWRAIDKSVETLVQPTKGNKIVKDVNEEQFYKDLPKASQGWQKFQDFNQLDSSSSESEQDVIFYKSQEKQQQFGQILKQNKWKNPNEGRNMLNMLQQSKRESLRQSQPKFELNKVFSPFDLN